MDNTNIKRVEDILQPIDLKNVKDRIKSTKGHFFSIDFARKNDKKVKGKIVEKAGTIRHMICRTGVAKYTTGVVPIAKRKKEDERNQVLTVWDVGVYQELRKRGVAQEDAGARAYRRINIADVRAISVPSAVQPIEQVKVPSKGVAEPVT